MKNIKQIIAFLLTAIVCFAAKAQVGGGWDGPLTVSSMGTTIDGTRAEVTNISGTGPVTLTLSGSYNYGTWGTTNQKAIVILMAQNIGGTPPTRNWQLVDVLSYSGSSIDVSNFAHTNWCTSSGPNCKIQVIAVPQYTTITVAAGGELTCTPWDGHTGGVLAFLANSSLDINGGTLNVAGKGFSNTNMGGIGGPGSVTPPGPAANPGVNPAKGSNGMRFIYDCFAPGQCASPPGMWGGDGGTGGFRTPGFTGFPGDLPETRQALPAPSSPKLLFLGNGGKEGKGGKGGGAAGNGSNGGNGGFPAIPSGTPAGGPASMGGMGGDGGTGGGVIIVMASNITMTGASTSSPCIDISGTSGASGMPLSLWTSTAFGGNGGNGGNAQACPAYIGYGGFGIRGQTGDGAGGGSGGGGGSIGSLSMRVPVGGTNDLNKFVHVTHNIGAPGMGAPGQMPAPLTNMDGQDGCPEDMMACGIAPCIKKVYDPYKCACFEAYRVLGDMDVAVDYGQYIKYTKSPGAGAVSKKNGAPISDAPADYYCLYYKCSRLLMAFEEAGTPLNPIMKMSCSGTPVVIYEELRANLYWCKMEESPCGTCDYIHQAHYNDLISGLPPTSSAAIMGSAPNPSTGLMHDFGTTDFGNDGTMAPRFRYDDIPGYAINGNGTLYEISNPANVCTKSCPDFRTEWIDLHSYYPCACGTPGSGTGGTYGGGPPPPPEVYPFMPYIPEMWDNPLPGDPGDPGDPGEEDPGYYEGGDFDPDTENGMSELVGISKISATGKSFTVSPNPTGNNLSVLVTGTETIQKADIKILDITGKVVFEKQGCNISNKTLVQDISKLHAGTYFISINAKNVSEVLKFIKQ
jgi:hypothetical protein